MGHSGSYGLSAAAMVVVYSAGYTLGPLVGGGLHLFMSFQGVTIVVAALVAMGTLWVAFMLPRR
jgi:hypothetical protein